MILFIPYIYICGLLQIWKSPHRTIFFGFTKGSLFSERIHSYVARHGDTETDTTRHDTTCI